MPLSLLSEGTTERFPWRSATVALVLHAAVIGALRITSAPAGPAVVAEPDQEVRLLDPTEEVAAAEETSSAEVPSGALAGAISERAANAVARPERTTPEATAIVEAPPTSSGAFIFQTGPTASAIGLGGPNPFLARGALPDAPQGGNGTSTRLGERPLEPKSIAEAQAAVNKELGEKLADRSKKGLGPEGPVINALEAATTGSSAPVRGEATFVAVIDGNGFVTDVKIASSNGDRSGWEEAGRRALAALKGKKVPGAFNKGDRPVAELSIHVASDIRLPSGASPDNAVQFGASGGNFDLADLGGGAKRVVHARLMGIREM